MVENEKKIEQSVIIMKETVNINTIQGNMQTIIKKKDRKTKVVYKKRNQPRPTVLRNSFQMKLF